MLRAFTHGLKNSLHKLKRNVPMEKIAHGVYKDHATAPPRSWQIDNVFMQCESEAVLIATVSHQLQSQCEALGITILAASAYLRATRHRIPRRLSPFDA